MRRLSLPSAPPSRRLAPALLALLLAGCAAGLGGEDYPRGQARQAMKVRFATVESVREVQIEGTKTPVGSAAGAVIGGVAGGAVGHGKGSAVGAVIGAVVGGVGGAAAEEAITRQKGMEITVKLDGGEYLAIVQADGQENFQPGEKVRLIGVDSSLRVAR
ncbi:MAG: hypothetical protein LBG69_06845 [Zoogloeaceae bacterium]|jgi:outer membrane lipoprotein SlyB|nr:hypothetical protein [Zoogloeaceae bacterium]